MVVKLAAEIWVLDAFGETLLFAYGESILLGKTALREGYSPQWMPSRCSRCRKGSR